MAKGPDSSSFFFFSILRITRVRIYRDMIEAFQAKDIMTSELKIVMVDAKGYDERGVDIGGVFWDAISCFWQEFNDSSTLGERERVPSLRHDFQSNEWSAIGRILAKGFLDLGYFPCMRSQAFIASVLFGENSVYDETLLKPRITSPKTKTRCCWSTQRKFRC